VSACCFRICCWVLNSTSTSSCQFLHNAAVMLLHQLA
jgi:hypothetical protein